MPVAKIARSGVADEWSLRWAALYGPWALFVGGVILVVAALVLHRSDAVAVAAITGGIGCSVAGAVLPRAKGSFSGPGVSGTLQGIPEILDAARAFAEAAIPDEDPAKTEKVDRVVGRAYDLLSSSANEQGLTFAHTAGARSFTLTGRQDGEVATAVVLLPELLRLAFEQGTSPRTPQS